MEDADVPTSKYYVNEEGIMKKSKGKSIIKSKNKKKKPLMRKLVKIFAKKTSKPAKKKQKALKSGKPKVAAGKKTAKVVKKIKKAKITKVSKPVKKLKTASKSKPAVVKKTKVTKPKVKSKSIKKIKKPIAKKTRSIVVAKTISLSPLSGKKKTVAAPVKMIAQKAATISSSMGIKSYVPTKNESYMSPKQIEHFKNILNIWKEQLMAEMNRTVQHMKTYAANFPDPVDRASQEEDFNLELKTRERERKLIKKIDEALEKIQGGDYGFCVECGAEIGIGRLEARPTASQCIECKTIAEIREKQTGG